MDDLDKNELVDDDMLYDKSITHNQRDINDSDIVKKNCNKEEVKCEREVCICGRR